MSRSFSGCHTFRPSCLVDVLVAELDCEHEDGGSVQEATERVEEFVRAIDAGRCPRCGATFADPPTAPAGSRITDCRCVPICGPCGEHEASPHGALVGVSDWPLDQGRVTLELDAWLSTAILATFIPSDGEADALGLVLSADGVTEVVDRPHPGGWAEFGHDEDPDDHERRGR